MLRFSHKFHTLWGLLSYLYAQVKLIQMYLEEGAVSQEQIFFAASVGKRLIALQCALDFILRL